ncbi:MAG: heat-shock protein Hsp20 [Deltaproteobacteria bacterium HGW-Deltaproteobacteria-3]|nr:MAG: heat-shock protein Hsp20 [Deltaproteobacteria bacterium HGW-Deltaproteobacteria-3]
MDHSRKKTVPSQSAAAIPRNILRQRMFAVGQGGSWFPAADVYETASALIVHMDISGMDPRTLSVVADGTQLTVSGERGYEPHDMVSRIHQLEIERGFFERSIPLPKPVDVSRAVSESRNGFLLITLPLRQNTGKIKITVG